MKVIKPLSLGVLTRPFEVRRQCCLGISVFAFLEIGGRARLHTEQDMWRMVPEALGDRPILDEGVPKSLAEFLVVGRAYPPTRPATTCPIEVELGRLRKSLSVIGPRFWRDGVPSAPEPFESVHLGWANSFGGEGYAKNPVGRGAAPVAGPDGARVHPLPLIEHAGRLIDAPSQRPEPAGLGAYPVEWPQRARFMGTYDQAWLEEDYPGYAKDTDWRLHNMAPEDQQQAQAFRGDERYRLVNLHPTRPELSGELPGLRARAFIQRAPVEWRKNEGRPPGVLSEVPLSLMTVWFLPDQERAILVYSGSVEVSEDDARDVSLLAIACERTGEPRPLEHYDAVVARRCDKDNANLEALADEDLVPAELMAELVLDDPESMPELRMLHNTHRGAVRAHEKMVAEALQKGVDPSEIDVAPPEPPDTRMPPLKEVRARLDAVQKLGDEKKKELEEKKKEMLLRDREIAEEHGLDPDALERALDEGQRGPPKFRAEAHREEMRARARAAAEAGTPMPWLEAEAEDPERFAEWLQQERQLIDMYRASAHLQKPADSLAPEMSAAARADVMAAIARGESFDYRDLTGIDLRGMDLAGANLAGALLEAAKLDGAKLNGADLRRCVLAHASLTGTDLRGADLREANLGAATLVETLTDEATDMRDAQLMDLVAAGAGLRGVHLEGATFMRANLENADLTGAHLDQAQFLECTVRGARFERARLRAGNFVQLDLRGAVFDDVYAPEANFVECNLEGALFRRADLTNARFVHGTVLTAADFRHARLPRSCFRGADLRRADLGGTLLDQSDFGDARLDGANLYACSAKQTVFIRASLRDATMMRANLMEALLGKADVRGADLRESNLYGADCARLVGDVSTQLDGADQTRARTRPRWEPAR
ncbi:MAG: DUF2169 domain-containing protein [Sandaracinaceae bacterium]